MNNISFNTYPELYTGRLVLRQLTSNDANEILEIRSNEQISEFLNRPVSTGIDEAKKFISMINHGIKDKKWFYWGIHFKDLPNIIGTICIWKLSEDMTRAEVGFELLPIHQGKGIMDEALKTIIDFAFNNLGLTEIEAEVAPGNSRSINLLERNKFSKISEIRDNDSDDVKNFKTVMYHLVNSKM